jgi:prepilin-type N-terminal cleavage/methylation domain-containing protein
VSRAVRPPRGFTLLELLISMAMFAVLGIAVVALLGQGMTVFTEGTSDTRMADRLQAILPTIQADFAAMQPASAPEVLPPPPSESIVATAAPAPSRGPAIRLRSGWVKIAELPPEWPKAFYVAFARTNARETEDPILRQAGTAPVVPGQAPKAYEPAVIDAGGPGVATIGAPGGLMEVVWIAVPEDPDPERRKPSPAPPVPGQEWPKGVHVLYRLFRAPVGGPKSLLDPASFDSLAEIRAAGRVMHEGVLHFGATFRNVFSKSWTDGAGSGRVQDGQAYVGSVWDSTRALDKDFPLFAGADSLGNVRDDVFPAWARVELTLGVEGEFGFGRGETTLVQGAGAEEKTLRLDSVDPLLQPGPEERWLKVGAEWMSTTFSAVDPSEKRVTVARGRRATPAVEHASGEPVYVGSRVFADVPLVFKDRYVRR